MLFHIGAQNT